MAASPIKTLILSRFLEHCHQTACLPLDFLPADDDVRICPTDPAFVMNLLTEEFAEGDLVVSGLAADVDGAFAVVPPLLSGPFIVLRDSLTREPIDLLTEHGCLSPGSVPALAVLRDHRTQQFLEDSDSRLYVTFSIADAIVFRACGLAATFARGLDTLPFDKVDQFCDSFEFPRRASCRRSREMEDTDDEGDDPDDPQEPSASQVCAQLILVGWTPSTLCGAAPGQLNALVEYLNQLDRFLGVELCDLGLWSIQERALERLRFIADLRSAKTFRDAMLEIADAANAIGIGLPAPRTIIPPADYSEALARLHEASSGGPSQPGGLETWKPAWNDVQRLLHQQVIDPIRGCALATGDPVAQSLLMGIAEVSQIFHSQAVLVGEQLNRSVSQRVVEHVDPLSKDSLRTLLALADRLVNLTEAIDRCTPSCTTIIQAQSIGSKTIPCLPHSASIK